MNVNELIKQAQKRSGPAPHLDRMYAVKELAKLPVDPKVDKALIEATEDEYAEVVRAAVRGLAHRLDEVAIRNAVQYVADYHADWTAMSFAQDALAAFDAAKAATEVTETEPAEVVEVANAEVQPPSEVIVETSETKRQREALSRLREVAYRHYSEIANYRDLYGDICNNKFNVPLWLPNTEYATLRKQVVADEKTRYGSINFPPHGIRDYASERQLVLSLFSEWITRDENRNLTRQVGMKPYRVDPIMITEYDDESGMGVRIYNPYNGDNHIFQITYSSTMPRDAQRAGFMRQAQARFEAAKRDPQGFFNND